MPHLSRTLLGLAEPAWLWDFLWHEIAKVRDTMHWEQELANNSLQIAIWGLSFTFRTNYFLCTRHITWHLIVGHTWENSTPAMWMNTVTRCEVIAHAEENCQHYETHLPNSNQCHYQLIWGRPLAHTHTRFLFTAGESWLWSRGQRYIRKQAR